MGCTSSSNGDTADNKAAANGKAAANADNAEAENTPKQNPYMTLTHKEIFRLKMSWKGIKRCLEETGVVMFSKMFEAKPELKNYFEKFKNMSLEVLYKSDALLNHATNVMETIDTTVTELDDAEKTHQNLKKLGLKHKTLQVPDEVIKEMRDPFLKAIEQTLGDRYSDAMRTIYEVFIDYVIRAMIDGYSSS